MTIAERDDHFYASLPPFDRFDGFADIAAYAPVPADWVVMITDVVGSTRAIEAGRYKAVNMVGAASITAVLNVCGDIEVPFGFGGDGGIVVVPGSLRPAAAQALTRLQAAAESMFGLSLRVGAVPVADLRARGHDLRVRKYRLSPGNFLAMFTGGGIEAADRLLKAGRADDGYVLAPTATEGPPDLDGLSCRWEPLASTNGRMMSLIVAANDRDERAAGQRLAAVVRHIATILGHDLQDSAPASPRSMRFRWPPRGLMLEARATAGEAGVWRRYLRVLLSSAIQYWCERFDRKAGNYDAPVYRQELRANTDFRRFDGTLRMVLDVTPAQAAQVEAYLEAEHRAGHLVHGLHVAERALMTCLLFNLEQSEHVHFVDGDAGGFAVAASQMKARLATTATPSLEVAVPSDPTGKPAGTG